MYSTVLKKSMQYVLHNAKIHGDLLDIHEVFFRY